jgi:hypothetical protein
MSSIGLGRAVSVLSKVSKSTLCSCAFSNPVVSANTPEHSLAKDFDRHTHSSTISQFFGFSVEINIVMLTNKKEIGSTYPNLAVSGSLSSNSLMGDLGTWALKSSSSGAIMA